MLVSIDDCWRRIGVAGNRQCPELGNVGHCRNCSRYGELAVQLLDREPPEGHIELATELLAAKEEIEDRDTLALIVFRVAGEWLALPAEVFEEVSPPRPICPIPHRSNNVLLGLVNVRGSLHLCISIAALLGIGITENAEQLPDAPGARLLVIGQNGNRWAFGADEVCGILRVALDELLQIPATSAKISASLAKAIFAWRETHAGLLDDHRFFDALRRSIS